MNTEPAPAEKAKGPGIPGALIGLMGVIALGLSVRIAMIPVTYQGVNYGIVLAVAGFLIGAGLLGNSAYLYLHHRHFLSMHEYAVLGVYGLILLFLVHAAAVATIMIILSFASQIDF
jgi:hypothetical protein